MDEDFQPSQHRAEDGQVIGIAARLDSLHRDVSEMRDVLRELTSAITRLALVEERQLQTATSLERAFKALEKVELRVSELEKQAPLNKQSNKWMEMMLMAVAGAALSFVAMKVGLR